MSKSDREAKLEERVEELEDTVRRMMPSRRDFLLGSAVAGAAGLSGFGAGTAAADGHNDGDTQWGTNSNRDDYVMDHLEANSGNFKRSSVTPSLDVDGSVQDATQLGAPHDVQIQDGLAYTVGKDGTFAIVNVADPDTPKVLGSITSFSNAEAVFIDGNYAYVGDADTVYSINVTDPTNPGVVSSVTDSSIADINGVDRWNEYLFAASKHAAINVVDISDPTSLRYVGSYSDATNLPSPHDIIVFRDHLIVPNQNDGDTPKLAAINAIQASDNVLKPTSNWSVSSTVSASDMNGANRVVGRNPYLFVANNYSDTITAVDATDLNAMSIENTVSCTGVEPSGLAIMGEWLIAAEKQHLELFDISTPTNPESAAVHDFGATVSGHDSEAYGSTIIYTAQATDEVYTVDAGRLTVPGLHAGSAKVSNLHVENHARFTELTARDVSILNGLAADGRAYLSADTSGFASGSWVTVPLDTVESDTDDAFDLANNQYVIPEDGDYRISYSFLVLSPADQNLLQGRVMAGGSSYAQDHRTASGTKDISVSNSDIAQLNKGDTVTVEFKHDSASNLALSGFRSLTYLSIDQIPNRQ